MELYFFQHTLLRREQWNCLRFFVFSGVSIHAPMEGAIVQMVFGLYVPYFVSTHAPTQGATKLLRNIISADKISDLNVLSEFQLTLPCRKRQYIAAVKHLSKLGFNSRSHTGSDFLLNTNLQLTHVSIHAPPQRAIHGVILGFLRDLVSNHAPTQGAMCKKCRRCCAINGFNSRSNVGSNTIQQQNRNKQKSFNSRSHGGSDLAEAYKRIKKLAFQFTLPWRERFSILT